MNGTQRVALFSVLHPVRAAAEGVLDQIWIAEDESAMPTAEEALRALRLLQIEVGRATTLVQRLADRQDA